MTTPLIILVVKLFHSSNPGLGGTVLEVTQDSIADLTKRYSDRDGCKRPDIRFWQGSADNRPGDLVRLP